MGALVAGAWVAGRSPAEMREAMSRADWNGMFLDGAGDADLDLRARRLRQRFLPGSETGFVDGGAVTPPALVQGQRIKFFLNALVRSETGEPQIEKLPLPLSIIATDIGTGERIVMRDGPLTEAMRASMAVPGCWRRFRGAGASWSMVAWSTTCRCASCANAARPMW
jgi:NTE family protein